MRYKTERERGGRERVGEREREGRVRERGMTDDSIVQAVSELVTTDSYGSIKDTFRN